MNVIVGSIAIPFDLSSKKRIQWLEEWIYSSSEGLLIENIIVELHFSYREHIDKSMKHLINTPSLGWMYFKDNVMIAPNGIRVRFYHDENAEELLNQYKKHD